MHFFAISFMLIALFEVFISSCASKSSPNGGPKDTLAPKLDTAFPPNQSIFFKAKEIELRFEEYVELKNPFDQINISPLLKEDLEVKGRGKKVSISLPDSLKDNTTYIISFGSSLADLTEGNVNKNFKYVFSTGSYIDSLVLRGHLNNAYSGEAEKEFLVALYSADRKSGRDSFLLKERPDYYAFSDEEGGFEMTNIKGGKYLLAAFEDKDGDFKRNNPKDEMAFWPDTILISPDTVFDLRLFTYEPEQSLRFYNARQEAPGHVQLAWNLPADSFKVEVLNAPIDSGFFYYSKQKDTLNYYFDFAADSLLFKLNYDSLFVDSIITVRLRQMSPISLKLKSSKKDLRRNDTIKLRSNRPITKWVQDSLLLVVGNDSLRQLPVADSSDPFQWYYYPPHKSDIKLELKAGAMEAGSLISTSAQSFNYKLFAGEELGSIDFKVKVADSSSAYVLEIQEEKGQVYLLKSFSDSTLVSLKNEIPRKFKVFLIQDRDGNGKFSPGNFQENRVPERRIPYQEGLEIRANWELTIEWTYLPK